MLKISRHFELEYDFESTWIPLRLMYILLYLRKKFNQPIIIANRVNGVSTYPHRLHRTIQDQLAIYTKNDEKLHFIQSTKRLMIDSGGKIPLNSRHFGPSFEFRNSYYDYELDEGVKSPFLHLSYTVGMELNAFLKQYCRYQTFKDPVPQNKSLAVDFSKLNVLDSELKSQVSLANSKFNKVLDRSGYELVPDFEKREIGLGFYKWGYHLDCYRLNYTEWGKMRD